MCSEDLKDIKVLLAEDEPNLTELLSSAIGDCFDEFIIASNGKEAIEKFNRNRPDIVITDIMMPKMSGLEMAKELKAIDPDLPIIILSAYSETDKLLQAIDLGVIKYFIKPFDPEELIEYIRTITPKIRNHRVIKLENGFSFNNKTKKLYKNEKMVALTKREQMFIDMMINSKEEIVDEETIKRALWSEDATSERLRTFIKRVRMKTSKTLIKNILGQGYNIEYC